MEKKEQEQVRVVCEYILANTPSVESPEVLVAARELLKAMLDGVKSDLSVPALTNAIRRATDLSELKHLVGPDPEENELAARRLDKIEAIWSRNEKSHGSNPNLWPLHEKDAYDRLMAEQRDFEREYC